LRVAKIQSAHKINNLSARPHCPQKVRAALGLTVNEPQVAPRAGLRPLFDDSY